MNSHIDPTTIARVYSGKPGCGCGCRGRYFEDARNIRRVVKLMNASDNVGITEGLGRRTFYVETETRYLWAYEA